MRRSRRPALHQRSGRRGSREPEDRWIVHAARVFLHAGFGSRNAAAVAWRKDDAPAAQAARGSACRLSAKAREVRWRIHRASLPGVGIWRRPRSKCKIDVRRRVRELGKSPGSRSRRSGCTGDWAASGWRHAETAQRRLGAPSGIVACPGGGAGALREPVPGRTGHVRLGHRRHRTRGAVQRHAAARHRLPAARGDRQVGPGPPRRRLRRGSRAGAGSGSCRRACTGRGAAAPAAGRPSARRQPQHGADPRRADELLLPVDLAGRDRPQAGGGRPAPEAGRAGAESGRVAVPGGAVADGPGR